MGGFFVRGYPSQRGCFNIQAGNFAAAAAAVMDSLGACRDTFAVVTNTNGGDTPVICGQNDGQHSKLLTKAISLFNNI